MFTLPEVLTLGTARVRYEHNLAAIRIVRALDQEGRAATPEEAHQLALYSGWGSSEVLKHARKLVTRPNYWGSSPIVEPGHAPNEDMAALLSAAEWSGLLDSTPNAHYTSLPVIRAIWEGIRRTGVVREGCRMLEPACGVGHFLGACPADMRQHIKATLIELDPITSRIAQALYPEASVTQADFAACFRDRYGKRDGSKFDLTISNVPFGKIQMSDPGMPLKAQRNSIHNYFISRMLELTRPGGLCVAITSRFSLDGRVDAKLCRQIWSQQADLVLACRLPDNAFRENAGTDVVTDILFFRKRPEGESIQDSSWTEVDELVERGGVFVLRSKAVVNNPYQDPITVRSHYYTNNPDNVLGVENTTGKMYASDGNRDYSLIDAPDSHTANVSREVRDLRYNERHVSSGYNVQPFPASSLSSLLNRVFAQIPEFTHVKGVESSYVAGAPLISELTYSPDTPDQHRLWDIYQRAKAVIQLQIQRCSDEELATGQELLIQARSQYPDKIHSKRTEKALSKRPDILSFLKATEKPDGKQEALYQRRTIYPEPLPAQISDPIDALYRCLDTLGRLSLEWIADTCSMSTPDTLIALGDNVFYDPELEVWVLRDEYLSGNVRKKLNTAQSEKLDRNVSALEAVQPQDLQPSEISVRLQSPWVPQELLELYLEQVGRCHSKPNVEKVSGSWILVSFSYAQYSADIQDLCTERVSLYELVEHALTGSSPRVYDQVEMPDGKKKRVLNPEQTALAEAKLQHLQAEYRKFLFCTPERTKLVMDAFNWEMNCHVMRKWDGSFLTFPGMNSEITLRDFQLNGVAQCLLWDKKNHPLFAWMTGAGKTFGAIAAVEKRLQLGLAKKVLICVPKHLVPQWQDDYRLLFPGRADQILCAEKDSLTPAERGTFLARAATSSCRVVICSHTQLKAIPVRPDTFAALVAEQRKNLEACIADAEQEMKFSGEKHTPPKLKRLRVMLKNLETRIKNVEEATKKDSSATVTWEELGIDMFVGDEAHAWKNLALVTRSEASGIPTGCQASQDFFTKIRYCQAQGGQVLLLTATPIANTLAEAYVFATYLQHKELVARELDNTDAFLASFTSPYLSVELDPSCSSYRTVSRLEWANTGELVKLLHQSWHYVGERQIGIALPTMVTGQEIICEAPGSLALNEFIQELASRAEDVKKGRVDPAVDNMLRICSDGRWASLVNGPPDGQIRHTKLDLVIQNTHKLWQVHATDRASQLIFCDLGTPSGRSTKEEAPEEILTSEGQVEQKKVYEYIRQGLRRNGIPDSEIAFLQQYQGDPEKLRKLYADVNAGRIRVLLGSAPTGMNVQERLVALHHVDPVWRPDWKTQRDGRIIRQGNTFGQVYVYLYLTSGSFDAYMWGLVRAKLRVIDQIVSGDASIRRADGDVGDIVLRASEIQAIASGNPGVLRVIGLQNELQKLYVLRKEYIRQQELMAAKLTDIPARIASLQQNIQVMLEMSQKASKYKESHEKFSATIFGKEFDDPALAAEALLTKVPDTSEQVGFYRGLPLFRKAWGSVVGVWLDWKRYTIDARWNTPTGLWASLNFGLSGIPQTITRYKQTIQSLGVDLVRSQGLVGQAWAQEPEYARRREEYYSLAATLKGSGFVPQTFPKSDFVVREKRWLPMGQHEPGLRQMTLFGVLRY